MLAGFRWAVMMSLSCNSLWTGCIWSHSPWCGCLYFIESPPQKRLNTRPDVTSVKSVPWWASGKTKVNNGEIYVTAVDKIGLEIQVSFSYSAKEVHNL